MLQIAGHSFTISDAEFSATIWDHELWWDIEFCSTEMVVGGMDCAPRIRSHAKLILPPLHQLSGARVELPDNPDDAPSFVMLVHEHEPIEDCALEFGQWIGTSLDISLTGRALDFASEDGLEFHSFALRHLTPFAGVVVMTDDASTALTRVSEHFDPSQFSPPIRRDRAPGFLFKPLETGPDDSFMPTTLHDAAHLRR